MQDGVLDAADVLVDRHPVVRSAPFDHATLIAWRAVAEKIPGRLNEGVHGVGLAPRATAAAGASGADEGRMAGQRRTSLTADLDVARQHNREIFLLLRYHAAGLAVEDGDRRPPVALAADAPVTQTIVDFPLSETALDQPVDHPPLGLGHGEPVEEAGVNLDAVACVGLAGPA